MIPPSRMEKNLPGPLAHAVVEELVRRALLEDVAGGDLTSETTVPADAQTVGRARAKSALVACGAQLACAAFEAVDPTLTFEVEAADGQWLNPGQTLWTVQGSARSILAAERTALNFVQRMSGIATLAHRFVRMVPVGCSTRIADTRKTTPGLRALERYAVRCGGAHNHRDNLSSAVMIKDNHILAAGGIASAVQRARNHAPHTARIEVEVEDLGQLSQALEAGADIVMLDNFSKAELERAISMAKGRAQVEVSGNITLERVAELARSGVDIISVGALTHSAPAADISLGVSAPR